MKTKKTLVKFLVTGFLATLNFAAFADNRLATDMKQAQHCNPLPKEQCSPSLKRHFNRGCISKEEHDYGAKASPQRVPLCVEIAENTWKFHAWCYCSCFAKGTRILVEDKVNLSHLWLPIEDVTKDLERYHLVVPSSDAKMGNMKYETREIKTWTAGHESNPLYILKTKSGEELIITGNHQVVLASGQLAEASNLKVGDNLVHMDGSSSEIASIDFHIVEDDVYNVLTSNSTNLVFAEGVMVGDLLWENSPEDKVKAFAFPK